MDRDQRNQLIWIAVAVAIILVVLAAIFTTHPITVKVIGQQWGREQKIENYEPRRNGDWHEMVPSDAYNMTCYTKQRSTRQVKSGEDCETKTDSDGDTRRVCKDKYRSEPVYDTYCDYTVDRWQYARSQNVGGTDRRTPFYWPTPDFVACAGTYGCERLDGRNESYVISFSGDSHTLSCPVAQEMWLEYKAGDAYTLDIGTFIQIPRCETLKAVR